MSADKPTDDTNRRILERRPTERYGTLDGTIRRPGPGATDMVDSRKLRRLRSPTPIFLQEPRGVRIGRIGSD